MLHRLCSLVIVIFLAVNAAAAKYAGESFSLGVGARALALGGAVTAGPFDGTAGYWNPAGMHYLNSRTITAMHAETFGSLLNHDFIAYIDARPRDHSRIKAFGFYFYYLGGGGIKITRLNEFERPYVLREEAHGDFLFTGSVSGKITSLVDFGLTAKIIYRDIGTESGYGLTMDAGMLYRVNKYARLGLMVTDITTGFIRYSGGSPLIDSTGEAYDSDANTESIYPTVKPGLMIEYSYLDFNGRFLAGGDIKFENIKRAAQYWSGPLSLDTHFGWELDYKALVFGRAGFDIGRFTAGGGVDIKNITVDFAYMHHSDLDETFRVSAGYRF
ncbi:MAG: hypothetical protein PHU88_01730 [candidate division Zixibacteria bacterium]|nr:hypothetical protein [candidate division Zixibacteria bacterium]MDD5427556.1 hypothetical protein [candidate division Zixibacteria bacterium]